MFESLRDPTGYKQFRKEYYAHEALVCAGTWEKFLLSKAHFFNHPSVFFGDEWLSVVNRGLFHITRPFEGRRPAFLSLSRMLNVAKLEGWFYLDFRSFDGVVASKSEAPTLIELAQTGGPKLDEQKFGETLQSLRQRFDWIGFRACPGPRSRWRLCRAWDGRLFWGGDDGSHRFAALCQYCVEHDVAHVEPFRLTVHEIDVERMSELQTEWRLFLTPPEIGLAVNRAANRFLEGHYDLEPAKLVAYTVELESDAIIAPIELVVVRAASPGAAILSTDSRLVALNPLLDQMCRKQTSNIQGLINAVEHVDKDSERGRKP